MINKRIKAIFLKYQEIILYIFFGGLTTLVNFIIYYPVIWWTDINYLIANVIAWVGAVIFAFFTNKSYVFKDKTKGTFAFLKQFSSFTVSRLFSFGVETLFMFIGVEIMSVSEDWIKFPVAIIVIILNYITGKLIVFKKK